MYTNILEYLEENACKNPERIAIADETESLTYTALHQTARKLGAAIARRIERTHMPIVAFMEKCPELLASFYGIVESGNAYVCIDSKMAVERIRSILSTMNPSAILVKEEDVFPFEPDCPILTYEELLAETEKNASEESMASEIDAILRPIRAHMIDTDPLYLLYTSGSTGLPKGSVITHKSVIAYAEWVVKTFDLNEETIFGSQTPFYFSMSVLDIYSSLKCGGRIEIIPKKYFSFPLKLLQYVAERQVNTIYWVPSALSIAASMKTLDYISLPDLKKILFAGEVMPTKLLNTWKKHFPDALYANLFGPTEITDIALYYIVNREFRDDEPLPIGNVCENMDAFAINEEGKEITGDEIGELYFRGSFVGAGYINAPEKTAEAFVQNPLQNAYPEIVYKTGDLVRKNAFGEYMYAGRKDFQIKHMGYRIELGEIETAASAQEKVEANVALFDAGKDEIVLFYQGKATEEEMRLHLANYLPEYMRPNRYVLMRTMPHNANGKIDRLALQKEYF